MTDRNRQPAGAASPPMAHSRNRDGKRQPLAEHLTNVAELASTFAAPFGGGELAYRAGIWHDLGKYHTDFQRYLRDAEAGIKRSSPRPTHKIAGTCLAARSGGLAGLAFLIAGHHGGLPSGTDVKAMIAEHAGSADITAPLIRAGQEFSELVPSPLPALPGFATSSPARFELFLRMLFSALVDADFLDTEHHFAPWEAERRNGAPVIEHLWQELRAFQEGTSGRAADLVNQVRHEVYLACQAAAELEPGFFRLTVPTGGGKTRSGLAFALRHAVRFGRERVIVAIPYTSITEQTVDVYRSIFSDGQAVLEHHSAARVSMGSDDEAGVEPDWPRLAAQNWDAPIVVTTTVQLFESLLGRSTRACRKLHNVANSVIILDEVQTLPPGLLEPTLDVLRELVAHYRVSVVLCTATQPALDERSGFPGISGIREIVPDPPRLFNQLRRVNYDLRLDEPWSWSRVADEMRQSTEAMTIVNTKRDALNLLQELDDPSALHLSTLLCSKHRRAVLTEVKRRLAAGEPCRLVATQVVEAGVDLDFPLVLRALGPLDRVVQAAGRCNREGRWPSGNLIVFAPEEGGLPSGAYRTATDVTRALLNESDFDFHDPTSYESYFRQYYGYVSHDEKKVQEKRWSFDYVKVAESYRLIDDDTVPLVVHYGGAGWGDAPAGPLIERLQQQRGRPRDLFHELQQYVVTVRPHELRRLAERGLAVEVAAELGLWQWLGHYDDLTGIGPADSQLDILVV